MGVTPSVLVRVKAGDHGGEVAVGLPVPARLSRNPLDIFEIDKAPGNKETPGGKTVRNNEEEEKKEDEQEDEKSTGDCNAGRLSISPKDEGGATIPPSPGVKHKKVPRYFLEACPLGNEPHGNTGKLFLCDAEAVCVLAALLQHLQKLRLVHDKTHGSDRALHLVVVESPVGVLLRIWRGPEGGALSSHRISRDRSQVVRDLNGGESGEWQELRRF